MSFGPDSAMVAVTLEEENFNGGLELLSVPGLELISTVRVPPGTLGRFSRDGRSFIYGDRQGRLWTLDPRTWKPRGRPLSVSGPLVGADLSPDGRLLATTSADGTARLWNVDLGTRDRRADHRRLRRHRRRGVHRRRQPRTRRPHPRRFRLARAAVVVGAPRVHGRRTQAHPRRVGERHCRSATTRQRVRSHSLPSTRSPCQTR